METYSHTEVQVKKSLLAEVLRIIQKKNNKKTPNETNRTHHVSLVYNLTTGL